MKTPLHRIEVEEFFQLARDKSVTTWRVLLIETGQFNPLMFESDRRLKFSREDYFIEVCFGLQAHIHISCGHYSGTSPYTRLLIMLKAIYRHAPNDKR